MSIEYEWAKSVVDQLHGLQAEIARLRGDVERLRLTDAEREAVWSAIEHGEDATVSGLPPLWTSALRQLLDRLGGDK